jgi:hypothetical protein
MAGFAESESIFVAQLSAAEMARAKAMQEVHCKTLADRPAEMEAATRLARYEDKLAKLRTECQGRQDSLNARTLEQERALNASFKGKEAALKEASKKAFDLDLALMAGLAESEVIFGAQLSAVEMARAKALQEVHYTPVPDS